MWSPGCRVFTGTESYEQKGRRMAFFRSNSVSGTPGCQEGVLGKHSPQYPTQGKLDRDFLMISISRNTLALRNCSCCLQTTLWISWARRKTLAIHSRILGPPHSLYMALPICPSGNESHGLSLQKDNIHMLTYQYISDGSKGFINALQLTPWSSQSTSLTKISLPWFAFFSVYWIS